MSVKSKVAIVVIVTCSLVQLTACTTTVTSRQGAQAAHDALDRYVQDRRTALDNLNASYRATYATLMRQHTEVSRDLLALERKADARAAADTMLLDWQRTTTFTAIAKAFVDARTRQVSAMQSRSDAIAAARLRYASAFAELELDVEKLDKAKSQMAELAQEEDVRAQTTRFLARIAEIYRRSQPTEVTTP